MRPLTLFFLPVCLAVRLHGQGTVTFANLGAGVNAPIYDLDSVTKLSGPNWVAQLWAGPTTQSIRPVSPLVAFSTQVPGIFLGGSQVIPTVPTGSPAFFQVRVWSDPTRFPTWDAVWATRLSDPTVRFGYGGDALADIFTDPLSVPIPQTPPLGGGPVTPPNLVGMPYLRILAGIPEPSSVALGVLCAGVLLLRGRYRSPTPRSRL